MTGHFFFSLLNPALSAILAATFVALWRRRPDQTYLGALALTFLSCGIAFIINDFVDPFDAPASRIASNLLFLIAVVAASVGALLRVKARIPVLLYAGICALWAVSFCWFLFIVPSTEARIYVSSATFAMLGGTTAWWLVRAGPRRSVDRLFVGLSVGLSALAVVRALATRFGQLDLNSGGSLRDSAYWTTVQATTPILVLGIGLAFLIALAIRLFDELSAEANLDFLTGLLNRRGFDKGVRALCITQVGDIPPAVMIVDIDAFKLINDSFGHAVGDEVIAAIAKTLATHGQADLVSRSGGEEFTLYYRSSSRDSLLAHAEAIRNALAETDFPGVPKGHRVTVSMGLHTRHRSETTTQMLAAADRALYTAKRAGRDRAVLAPAPAPLPQARPSRERRTGSRARAG